MSIIKEFYQFTLFNTINLFVNSTKKITSKTLLLIRLDAIGDYILFRNFIEILKPSPKYNNYKITLLGNIVWRELAETLDRKLVDEFIWIDTKRFHRNFFYRYKKLEELTSRGYEIVIHPTYSRTLDSDLIIKAVKAKEKIGSTGDFSNIKKWQKRITDKYYTKLLPAKKEIIFEFYRNKEFFENLLGQKLKIKKPYMKIVSSKLNMKLPKEFVLLFVGAGASFRKWPIENWVSVGEYIYKNYKLPIVLCGGTLDVEDGYKFESLSNYPFINLISETTLIDLAKIIAKARLVISNETSVPHIAVALGVPVIVISNGNHFGRFTPCPPEITNKYYAVYPFDIENSLKNFKQLVDLYGMGSKLDISQIKVEKVLKYIELIITKQGGENAW